MFALAYRHQSLLLASIARLTNALEDKQSRSRVNVDKQTSGVQTASASLRIHINNSGLLCHRHAGPAEVNCKFSACLDILVWQLLRSCTCSDKKIGAVASIRGETSTRRHVQQVPPPRAKTKLFGSSSAAILVHLLGFHCPHHSVKINCAERSSLSTEGRPSGQINLSLGLLGSTCRAFELKYHRRKF